MKLAAALVASLAFGGCGGGSGGSEDDFEVPLVCEPQLEQVPCARGVEPGREYEFNLLTHCGIEWAYLDGRYWVPAPKVDPPSDWAAIEGGTIVLRGRDEAVFEADKGGGARFVPAEAGFRPDPCA